MQAQLQLGLGYRFKPTEEELVKCFLQNKIRGEALPPNPIVECDLYAKETPWEIFNDNYQNIWYCFTTLKKTSKRRISRVAGGGTWHGGTSAKEIVDSNNGNKKKVIGFKKTFVFKIKGVKTDWIMHEFTLASACEETSNYVVCKIKNKKAKPMVHNHTGFDEESCDICSTMRLIRMNNQTENMGNKAIVDYNKQLSGEVLLANNNEAETEAEASMHGRVETEVNGNLASEVVDDEVGNSASETDKWIRSLKEILLSDDEPVVGNTTSTDDCSSMIQEYLHTVINNNL